MKTYKDLDVWQVSMQLITEVYQITSCFPKSELFCLTTQIIRSSISIPCNISEGYGRELKRELIRFLRISRGSVYELQTQLEIAALLKYINKNELDMVIFKCKRVEKMLNRLIYHISAKL